MVTAITARSGQTLPRTRQPSKTDGPPRVGPCDHLTVEQVLDLIPGLPQYDRIPQRKRPSYLRAIAAILDWLQQHPGDGWQARWLAAGADRDTKWLDSIVATDPRTEGTKRSVMTGGLVFLMLRRVVIPEYEFLSHYRPRFLYCWAREVFRPDLFAKLAQAGRDQVMQEAQLRDGLLAITKMLLRTGRDIDQLTTADLFDYRGYFYAPRHGGARGIYAAWDLLQGIGVLPADASLGTSLRHGQRSADFLVDYYQLHCQPVRDVLVRYLNERRASLDYSSWKNLANTLAGRFWADIEQHHPSLDTLNLPPDVATEWKQRLRTYTTRKGEVKPRKNYLHELSKVRAFYLDIQEWAFEDPSWAPWATASPIKQSDLLGMAKARKKVVSAMHQRIRERLPHLTVLVNNAEDYKNQQASLLAAATATPIGQTFHHDGATYLRTAYKSYASSSTRRIHVVLVEYIATGERCNLVDSEDDAFWTWATIETLRHTGIRIEELLEITHLALVSYRLPDTGETVPLLQIVPSKNNEERLLLVDPELASVLASVVKRLRDNNNGQIPLVARYDLHEKVTNPPLPHLFQRKKGHRPGVISAMIVRRMLTDAIARTGIRDNTGKPLIYTPHDFRRMFTTEAVSGGLPVHIAAKLLGHHDLSTTQSYLAVFQDELIRTYRAFLDQRRARRPSEEYREPTDAEWAEFQQHFALRRVELGDCGRPYGSGCQHEHACVRCPMLRIDPRQKPRLQEIILNLTERISEAKANGWRGEVEGLTTSRTAAENKLAALNRSISNDPGGTTMLGLPTTRPQTP